MTQTSRRCPPAPPTWQGPSGYGGAFGYREDATNFRLVGHRLYDPTAGRFLSRDPARDGGNWYVYCDGDPVNGADPEGLQQNSTDIFRNPPKSDTSGPNLGTPGTTPPGNGGPSVGGPPKEEKKKKEGEAGWEPDPKTKIKLKEFEKWKDLALMIEREFGSVTIGVTVKPIKGTVSLTFMFFTVRF